jgi:hypothetical protein
LFASAAAHAFSHVAVETSQALVPPHVSTSLFSQSTIWCRSSEQRRGHTDEPPSDPASPVPASSFVLNVGPHAASAHATRQIHNSDFMVSPTSDRSRSGSADQR